MLTRFNHSVGYGFDDTAGDVIEEDLTAASCVSSEPDEAYVCDGIRIKDDCLGDPYVTCCCEACLKASQVRCRAGVRETHAHSCINQVASRSEVHIFNVGEASVSLPWAIVAGAGYAEAADVPPRT